MAKAPALAEQFKANAPALVDYGAERGGGLEDVSQDEQLIPLIKVLQGLSPELETLDGAKPGMIVNSATQEIVEEFIFVPAARQHAFMEWKPREKGGGLVNRLAPGDGRVAALKEAQGRFGKLTTPEGTEIIETYYLYGVMNGEQRVVVPFSSTKIKKYQQFISRVLTLPGKPPLWGWEWHFTTVKEKNAKGEFWNWRITPKVALRPDDPVYVEARNFHDLVASGGAVVKEDRPIDDEEVPPLD